MKDDLRYQTDFWYVDALKTVDAPLVNNVRYPPAIGAKYIVGVEWQYMKGQRVNTFT